MLPQLIQRQVPIGSRVSFELKSGRQVSGILVELGREHVTLEHDSSLATILIETIGAWQVLMDLPTEIEEAKSSLDHKSTPAISPPEHESSQPSEQVTDSSDSPTPEVLRKLLEIEARFQAQAQAARIQLIRPDFVFPANEFSRRHGADASVIWNRVKDKYSYAEKINEVSAKFGRIQPLLTDFRSLLAQFPSSPSLKRHLGYLEWVSGNALEAINLYKEAARISGEALDWYNLVALALSCRQEELGFYGLGRFFEKSSITEATEAWYLYVSLLQKNADYRILRVLAENKNRDLSDEEFIIILETGIYLLSATDHSQLATKSVQKWLIGQPLAELAQETIQLLNDQPSDNYRQLEAEFAAEVEKCISPPQREAHRQSQGHIYSYIPDRGFGFLRGVDGEKYFFHRSAISDDDLIDQIRYLSTGKQIPVVFEMADGPKGPLAIGITMYRTTEEMFARATEYANDGEYPKAIAQIKRVLQLEPDYPNAQEFYERWREYARVSGVPRGLSLYARAKRVQLIEKDLDRAAQLLRNAINQGDSTESAIKDLAALLAQQGKPEEAIQVLTTNRRRIQDQQSVDNLLINLYQNAGQYDQAITLLEEKFRRASTEGKKVQILWQIANGYLRKEDYQQAEQSFRKVLKSQPDNKSAQRNIAICFFKQERYDEAQQILNRILSTAPDAQAADLLEGIKQAQAGQRFQIDEIIIETTLSDLSREISEFAQFFLDRCDYQGVRADHIQKQAFDRGDIQALEQLATKSRTIRPRERAGYYLSAAKIASLLEDEDPNQFYKYLCRSFASTGDAIVIESRHLDAAREFYCESLSVYDGDRSRSRDEQDAVNALVRFLFSTLGLAQIPVKPSIPSIDETLETVLTLHPDHTKVFDAITYLVFRSRYAANRILNRIYSKSSLQAMALEYLKSRGISIDSVKRLDDFVRLWNELIRKNLDENRSVSSDFRFLTKLELTTASLESNIERVKTLTPRLFFDLDQQRVIHVQRVLETALELCKQTTFEEQERLCMQIDSRCLDLRGEIETSPTKLSVEELYPVVETVQKKVKTKLDELYETSIPQLTIRLPVESYTPGNDRRIEAQIVVTNRMGCSPAEALELIVQKYEDTFTVKLDGSLRGGDERILKVPLQVDENALLSKAFSLPVYAQYRTRSGDIEQTVVSDFSIRLDSEEEFEEIENPYAPYAEGGIVGNPEMFYGRQELINTVAKTLKESRTQSKCVVIYGQKRAGKSSILYHLERQLESSENLLILNLGNIGAILDEHSDTPFLYQILWATLKKLEYAVEDKVYCGKSALNLSFPSDKEFYDHKSPLVLFKDTFERFQRTASKSPDWHNIRPILLIDEFSYIHGYIVKGQIPESFMKNWKALLQGNYFSAVLVGQDVMPKFKKRFPNEFGTTQDERVTYLRSEDAVRLIDEPIRIGGKQGESRYRERAIERIIELTAGSPFYIQILCNRLVEYMNRKHAPVVTNSDVEQVKEELIRGASALTLDKFDNLINSGDTSAEAISDEDALKVLTSIATNSQTGPCSRHNIVCETRLSVDEILDDLVRRDVVERERGQYYSIRVGLFKEWLIVHQ